MKTIKYKLHHPDAIFQKAHSTDTGYDVKCVDYTIKGSKKAMLDLGISVQAPKGYYFELVPRSSISKTEFIQHNGIGIIDEDYRGRVMMPVILWNSAINSEKVLEQLIQKYFMSGKACAQLILKKSIESIKEQVQELSDTKRGVGGFGSTDSKQYLSR